MILEGEKHIVINQDYELLCDRDSFIMIPPYADIDYQAKASTKALILDLNRELLQNVRNKIDRSGTIGEWMYGSPLYLYRWNADLRKSVQKILDTSLQSEKDKEIFADLYAQELVYNLLQLENINLMLNLEESNFANLAVKYMRDNCCRPISIKTAASHFNMSEASFSQQFKKATGTNPKDYLTSLKLSPANEMLGSLNVTEVALSLGYENISHFISLFKKKYGLTPKQYQLMNQQSVR
jgi:AraC-like DNA-binding protein